MATTGENGEHKRRPVPTPAEVFPPHRKRPPSRPPSRPEPEREEGGPRQPEDGERPRQEPGGQHGGTSQAPGDLGEGGGEQVPNAGE